MNDDYAKTDRFMQGKWRCSACGSLNSFHHDNVCRKCMEQALADDEATIAALTQQ